MIQKKLFPDNADEEDLIYIGSSSVADYYLQLLRPDEDNKEYRSIYLAVYTNVENGSYRHYTEQQFNKIAEFIGVENDN